MANYLTEQELLREENLFAPHETSYALLKGRAYDLRSFKLPSDEAKGDSSDAIKSVIKVIDPRAEAPSTC